MMGTDTKLNRFRCRLLGHSFYVISARTTKTPEAGTRIVSECRRCAKIQPMFMSDEVIVEIPNSFPPTPAPEPGIIDQRHGG